VLASALLGPLALAHTVGGALPKVGSGYLPGGQSGADVLRSLMDDLFVGTGWGPQERPAPTPSEKPATAAPPVPPPTATAKPSAPSATPPPTPPPPAPSAPSSGATEAFSPAMMGIGYPLAVLGAGGLVVGGLIYAMAPQTYTSCMGAPCSGSPPDPTRRSAGTITMIAGAIGFGIGLPIGIIGSVPVRADEPSKPSAALRVGPTGAAVLGAW
jgi:hypothetical protein